MSKKILNKAISVRQLTRAKKTVYVMFDDGKFSHTVKPDNIDLHTLVGTYSWKDPLTTEEINDDLHHVLDQWRKTR